MGFTAIASNDKPGLVAMAEVKDGRVEASAIIYLSIDEAIDLIMCLHTSIEFAKMMAEN